MNDEHKNASVATEARSNKITLNIRLEREDDMPAFGAFLRAEEQHDDSAVVLINVQAVMHPEPTDVDGNATPMSRDDRKWLLVSTLMHEFGHVLESYLRLPVNEEAIEKACQEWDSAYLRAAEEREAKGGA